MRASTSQIIRCKHCRYRLDGLDEHRCPECGAAFDPDDPQTFECGGRYRIFATAVAALAAGFVLGIVATGVTALFHDITAAMFFWIVAAGMAAAVILNVVGAVVGNERESRLE